MAMAEHSICQPGRQGPKVKAIEVLPVFACFHKTKSWGERFSFTISTRAPETKPLNLYARAYRTRQKFHLETNIAIITNIGMISRN